MPGAMIGCKHKQIEFIDKYIKTGAGIRNIISRGCQGKNMMFMNKIDYSFFG
jgi:predicted house-cleaning NTP pyrophosphatase (Maf/HAM1 superfamily)